MNRLFYCDLDALPQGLEGFKGREEILPFQKLVDKFEAAYDPVANDGALFTFQTNRNAPLVRVDTNHHIVNNNGGENTDYVEAKSMT